MNSSNWAWRIRWAADPGGFYWAGCLSRHHARTAGWARAIPISSVPAADQMVDAGGWGGSRGEGFTGTKPAVRVSDWKSERPRSNS